MVISRIQQILAQTIYPRREQLGIQGISVSISLTNQLCSIITHNQRQIQEIPLNPPETPHIYHRNLQQMRIPQGS